MERQTCASYYFASKWAISPDDCEYFSTRSNYCCDVTETDNGCTLCFGGDEPTEQGFPTPNALATCQSFFVDVPKLVSANDKKLCTYWQDWAFLNCGCPLAPPRLPNQVDCDLLPQGCSEADIDSDGPVLESMLYAKLSRPTSRDECLMAQLSFDAFICNKPRQPIVPPFVPDNEGYALTILVQPDSLFSNTAWFLLEVEGDNYARVASSPVLLSSDQLIVTVTVPLGKTFMFVMMDAYGDGLSHGLYKLRGTFPRGRGAAFSFESKFTSGFFETVMIDTHLPSTGVPPTAGTSGTGGTLATVGTEAIADNPIPTEEDPSPPNESRDPTAAFTQPQGTSGAKMHKLSWRKIFILAFGSSTFFASLMGDSLWS